MLYRHLPHERKLTGAAKEKAQSLLQLKANKKLVQQALCEETGNVILLKDLSNVVNKRSETSRNDLDIVVDLLMNKYGELVADNTIHRKTSHEIRCNNVPYVSPVSLRSGNPSQTILFVLAKNV